MTTSERQASGFTLFEVMAAVLVLGIVFTMLADQAMQGLRSEGINLRRGEASLIADRRLAELEASLTNGPPLVPTRTEEEVPPYRVTIEVAPLDVMALLPEDPDGPPGAPEPEPELDSLLTVSPTGESRIQQVTVTVSWDEVGEPYEVTRRTFAFDTTGLEELLPSEESGLGGEGTGDDGGLAEELGGGNIPPELQNVIEQLE